MMRRAVLSTLVVVLSAAIVPVAALAKGTLEASLDGPGLASPIRFGGWSGNAHAQGNLLMEFAEAAGFFPAVWRRTPDPILDGRPKDDLGPRYIATYNLGGAAEGGKILLVQDVYPYAEPHALTYMAPGQRFYGSSETRGGWFVAASPVAPPLKSILVAAGLPSRPPPGSDDGGLRSMHVGSLAALGAIVCLGVLAAAFDQRRPGTAGAWVSRRGQ